MAFGGILGHLGLVSGLLGSFLWGFGVLPVGFGVSDVILEHLGLVLGLLGSFPWGLGSFLWGLGSHGDL